MPERGYKDLKGTEGTRIREAIMGCLGFHMSFVVGKDLLYRNLDALDAVLCTLAGVDFLMGLAMQPPDVDAAKCEGWIWTRDPDKPCGCKPAA